MHEHYAMKNLRYCILLYLLLFLFLNFKSPFHRFINWLYYLQITKKILIIRDNMDYCLYLMIHIFYTINPVKKLQHRPLYEDSIFYKIRKGN